MPQSETEYSDTVASHDPQPQNLSLGRYLQRERLKRNITIENIGETTGISPQILRAMEADDRRRLPADAFIKGFIKLYTKELGVDPEFALDLFARINSNSDSGISSRDMFNNEALAETRTIFSWRMMLASFILLLVLLFLYIAWQTYPVLQNSMLLKNMQVVSVDMKHQPLPVGKNGHDKSAGTGKPVLKSSGSSSLGVFFTAGQFASVN